MQSDAIDGADPNRTSHYGADFAQTIFEFHEYA